MGPAARLGAAPGCRHSRGSDGSPAVMSLSRPLIGMALQCAVGYLVPEREGLDRAVITTHATGLMDLEVPWPAWTPQVRWEKACDG
jgi:hypothetical protein